MGAATLLLCGAYGSCRVQGPEIVTIETPTTITYETPIYIEHQPSTYYGDLSISYDFDGFSCWDMGIESMEFEVYDWAGYLVVEDWDLSCSPGSSLWIPNLELGNYWIVLSGRGYYGDIIQVFETHIEHNTTDTYLHVSLY